MVGTTEKAGVEPVPPRPLSADERRLLRWLLSRPFPGRDELRRQARGVRVVGRCTCGCASLILSVDPVAPPAPVVDGMPVEAYGVAPDGAPLDVILWVRDGYLAEVEVVQYGEAPVPWPTPAGLTLFIKG